jgi:hypothetical protein
MIQNEEIAKVLEEIGDMLEIGGESGLTGGRSRPHWDCAFTIRRVI